MSKSLITATLVLCCIGIFYFLTLSSCQPCKNAISLPLKQKWKIVKILSKGQNPIAFNSTQSILFEMDSTMANYYEKTYLNNSLASSIKVDSKNVVGTLVNCTNNDNGTITIQYPDGKFRRYFLSSDSNASTFEATGYVNSLGSNADTLRYYYERIIN
jgi:hypothetical protein